jgi:hypothetical protein
MVRVLSPDRPCKQVTGLSGRTYVAKDGVFQMGARDAAALVKAGGINPSLSGVTRSGLGYRCSNPECGHGSYFKRCGKCGAEARREGED